MLSNFRSLFQSGTPKSRKIDEPPRPPGDVLEAGGANAFLAAGVQFVARPATFGPSAEGRTTRVLRGNEQLLHELERAAIPAAVAPLLFPVGLVAADGSARLGYEGFVLPTEGGTVPARYHTDPNSLTLAASIARWRDLLVRRADGAADLGVGFAGTVLPDKLTLLADYFPEPFVAPSPLMAAVEAMMAEQIGLASAAESVLPRFRADAAMKDLYRRIDPGLSPYGNWRLFQILIERLGLSAGIGINFAVRKLVRPTVGDSFFDLPMFEEVFETDSAVVLRAAAGITPQPDPAGYEGWQFWRNDRAPINQVVMLYGNPLIGTPEQGQGAPAWWFAAFFREVHVSHKNKYHHGYAMDMHPTSCIFIETEEGLEAPPLA